MDAQEISRVLRCRLSSYYHNILEACVNNIVILEACVNNI